MFLKMQSLKKAADNVQMSSAVKLKMSRFQNNSSELHRGNEQYPVTFSTQMGFYLKAPL